MARLTQKARNALPKSSFAVPGAKNAKGKAKGSYPIEDKAHARNALSRVSQYGSPAQKAQVRSKVKAKYPDIGKSKSKASKAAPRGK